jgi:hypothetical protein
MMIRDMWHYRCSIKALCAIDMIVIDIIVITQGSTSIVMSVVMCVVMSIVMSMMCVVMCVVCPVGSMCGVHLSMSRD